MPDLPGPDDDLEKKLREKFDAIEREEAARGNHARPPEPDYDMADDRDYGPLPEPPSNDEIRARLFASPIESQLNPDELGPQERISQDIERLMELQEEVRETGATELPEPPDWSFKRPTIPGQEKRDATGYLGIGIGISVAYTMVGATLGGWLIGWLIDRGSGGSIAQAIGTLIGAIVGLVGAVFTIVRAQNRQS